MARRDALTGVEQRSGRCNNTKGGGLAACIDIDQEGERGPALLGTLQVWWWLRSAERLGTGAVW